jgi:ribonucleoside-diphosphate reductase alpha chain
MREKEMVVPPPEPTRSRLPHERKSITHHFEIISAAIIGDVTIPIETNGYITVGLYYITVGLYDDGSPGEIFIDGLSTSPMNESHKTNPILSWVIGIGVGDTSRLLLNSWCIMVSMHLQCGASIEDIADKFRGVGQLAWGSTSTPGIRQCTSPLDYIAQWLLMKFGKGEE